ncbi:MAG: hypothetical protein SF052_14945 [Bacteroidia bacterium]|nr:hypothetical protein [Bacteroidia bacterium]
MKTINLIFPNLSRLAFYLLAILMMSLTACQPENVINEISEEDSDLVVLEAEVDDSYEMVDEYSMEAVEITDFTSMGRVYAEKTLPACAVVTHDSATKTITIDFGTGCTGADGKTRAGKIIVTYTKRLYIPGAKLTIELENYSVDGLAVEGKKTIENVSASIVSNISLTTTLEDGKITWPDGTFATREFTRTRTWVREPNPINDEFHVDGSVNGTRRNGDAYSADIISTLIFKRKCRLQGIHIPVQGIKEIKRTGKPDLLVDFGDGDCDHLVTLTKNGTSKVVDLSTK